MSVPYSELFHLLLYSPVFSAAPQGNEGGPQTRNAALADERTEPNTTVSSYGGIGGGHMAMHRGQGGRKGRDRRRR